MLNSNLNIELPYRVIKEDDTDHDIYIDTDMYTVNMILPGMDYLKRLQFPLVKGVIIRATSLNKTVTVHLLRDIDLFSSFCNLDMDLTDLTLTLSKKDDSIHIFLR